MSYKDIEFLIELEKRFNIKIDTTYEMLVHFQNSNLEPFQRWYPYREGYSHKLVERIINEHNITGPLLDPFVGSGSSVLGGRKKGLKTYGIDVNPLSIFISKVENRIYTQKNIENIENIAFELKSYSKDNNNRETNFNLADKYFNKDILQSLLQLKDYINNITSEVERDVFYLSWLSIIEEVSNVKKEGNGVKYKNRRRTKNGYINIPKEKWENENFPEDKFSFIVEKIVGRIKLILHDLKHHQLDAPNPVLSTGNSIELVKDIPNGINLTVFSPPYVNFFDYFEIHKMELWMGDFINNRDQLNALKKTGLRSTSSSLGDKPFIHENLSIDHLTDLLSKEKLWSNQIPTVIKGYFDDMESLLINLYEVTEKDGKVVIIVGNSAYAGIIVPTDLLIAEIAEKIGYTVEDITITRHLTTSSQQRKQLDDVMDYLRESIITLRKI